ncbi:MAG TPA: vWA domain-containing protein [Gaiellaceae bacterium]|jgi:hypothetical protein|nr:vWA domain-containing protein [Gaiellaceae bacterium]
MLAATLVFLTPTAGLVALAAALPLAALAVGERRLRTARRVLRLDAPPPARLMPKAAALAGVVALLGAAAAQPAIRTRTTSRVRTDAQALFVLDVSRSMAAAARPGAPTRLARAKRDAIAIRDALPEIPSGVATLTDRLLPSLLPSADLGDFAATIRRAVALEQPPPTEAAVDATSLGALHVVGSANYFAPSVRRRLVVVLTDGESRSFDDQAVARALRQGPGAALVLVHVWAPGETVYDGRLPEQGYHENAASGSILSTLADAAGGTAVSEHALSGAVAAARAALGSGPTVVSGRSERTRSLAPYAALLALLPLIGLARPRRPGRRGEVTGAPARAAEPAPARRGAARPRHPRTTT